MNGPSSGFDFLHSLLKRFSSFIYTGDREGDLLLMEEEIKEMRLLQLIDKEEYQQAMAAIAAMKKKE